MDALGIKQLLRPMHAEINEDFQPCEGRPSIRYQLELFCVRAALNVHETPTITFAFVAVGVLTYIPKFCVN